MDEINYCILQQSKESHDHTAHSRIVLIVVVVTRTALLAVMQAFDEMVLDQFVAMFISKGDGFLTAARSVARTTVIEKPGECIYMKE